MYDQPTLVNRWFKAEHGCPVFRGQAVTASSSTFVSRLMRAFEWRSRAFHSQTSNKLLVSPQVGSRARFARVTKLRRNPANAIAITSQAKTTLLSWFHVRRVRNLLVPWFPGRRFETACKERKTRDICGAEKCTRSTLSAFSWVLFCSSCVNLSLLTSLMGLDAPTKCQRWVHGTSMLSSRTGNRRPKYFEAFRWAKPGAFP